MVIVTTGKISEILKRLPDNGSVVIIRRGR
jgi:hypothetical protein